MNGKRAAVPDYLGSEANSEELELFEQKTLN